ncbi:MAG TPA: glycosyltransferase family 4 protein [Acidimicrobiales bacterium]|nr:glycosyltransferase family 4 protein [Acidimicrobiales bacterium]
MKILHFGPSLVPLLHDRGGACERRVVELAAAQVARGDEVTVLSRGEVRESTAHRGIRVESRPVRLEGVPRSYEILWHARRLARAYRPDIVHVHGLPDGALALKGLGLPSVLTVDWYRFWVSRRTLTGRLEKAYMSRALNHFSAVMPDSPVSAELFTNFWGKSKPLSVVPEGVALEQFHPDHDAGERWRAERGLSGTIVLYVGRLCEQKGTDVLLRAWEANFAGKGPTLVLAGPIGRFGREKENLPLRQRVDRAGAVYLGPVPERELPAVYNSCDVFIMPTTRGEMFGMAALEAQACGKPVVASRCGALPGTVGPEAGAFFDPGDSEGLTGALGPLLEDRDLRQQMGTAAACHASRFGWPSIAERVAAVYTAALGRPA